jgi:hypothetical protein
VHSRTVQPNGAGGRRCSACAVPPSPGDSECSAPSTGRHDMQRRNHHFLTSELVHQVQGMTARPQQQPQVDSGVQTSCKDMERREVARAPDPPTRAVYAQNGTKSPVSLQQEEKKPASGEENPKTSVTECAYLAGNLDDFYQFVAISKVLKWEDEGTKNRLRFIHKHTILVFGGESQDTGTGHIRLTKLLLDLKAQKGNENRVEFIIGSRDANKLRLASELQDDCISDPNVLNGMREYRERARQGASEGKSVFLPYLYIQMSITMQT